MVDSAQCHTLASRAGCQRRGSGYQQRPQSVPWLRSRDAGQCAGFEETNQVLGMHRLFPRGPFPPRLKGQGMTGGWSLPHPRPGGSQALPEPAPRRVGVGEDAHTLCRLSTCCQASCGCHRQQSSAVLVPAQPPGHRAGRHAEALMGRTLSESGLTRGLDCWIACSQGGGKGWEVQEAGEAGGGSIC